MNKPAPASPRYTLWQIALYMLKLGTLGFGGSMALVGYMQRDLVEGYKWIDEGDYKEGLALAQLAPGPLAAQLAIYFGYLHYGVLGATLVGIAFVAPSFLMVVGLGKAYVLFGGLFWMQAVFYGVAAAVIGIIVMSAKRLTEKSIGKDKLLWAIYLLSAAVSVIAESEIGWLMVAAGTIVWFLRAPPKFSSKGCLNAWAFTQLPAIAGMMSGMETSLLTQVGVFFLKVGTFAVGSGLTIVPFLYGGTVTEHQWLTERQFIDAVAVAMITPGPVVITVGFIGYLVAGFSGACVAALGTFFPCYLFTVVLAPYFKKYGKVPGVVAFIEGVTAAAIGATTGAVIVIAKHSITDIPMTAIALVTIALLWRFRKLQEPAIVAVAALLGLAIYPLVPH